MPVRSSPERSGGQLRRAVEQHRGGPERHACRTLARRSPPSRGTSMAARDERRAVGPAGSRSEGAGVARGAPGAGDGLHRQAWPARRPSGPPAQRADVLATAPPELGRDLRGAPGDRHSRRTVSASRRPPGRDRLPVPGAGGPSFPRARRRPCERASAAMARRLRCVVNPANGAATAATATRAWSGEVAVPSGSATCSRPRGDRPWCRRGGRRRRARGRGWRGCGRPGATPRRPAGRHRRPPATQWTCRARR